MNRRIQPNRGRRWGLLFVLLGATFCLVGFRAPRLVDRPYAPERYASVEQLRHWHAIQQPPVVTARAYLLYDEAADQILLESNGDAPLPPASLTKLMTALLVLERSTLTTTVTVAPADLVEGATMGLAVGERVTVEQLLWGLLIPSGNDAAMALARHTGGSVDQFVAQMNERANALGMTQSRFANSHGLDAPEHTSSARDLLTLALRLWDYAVVRVIAGSAEATVAGHAMRNTNELLLSFPGADGVKTGTSDGAGECIIASIQRNGRRVVIVVLGSRDRYADVRTLYAHYQANYQWVALDAAELPILNRVDALDGQRWYVRAVNAPPTRLMRPWDWWGLRPFRRLYPLAAELTWTSGQEIGAIEWRLHGELISVQTLVLW